jgi:hypothetical protein
MNTNHACPNKSFQPTQRAEQLCSARFICGDKSNSFSSPSREPLTPAQLQQANPNLLPLLEACKATQVVFNKQTHSNHGLAITTAAEASKINCFGFSGDYLITTLPGLAIGVMTADCVPIVVSDEVGSFCAVIHAGWRGLVAGVIQAALKHAQTITHTLPSTWHAAIGPCAGVCCYEVDEPFVEKTNGMISIEHLSVGLRGDLLKTATRQLQEAGLLLEHINNSTWRCTICSTGFFSYRGGDKTKPGHNVTLISL